MILMYHKVDVATPTLWWVTPEKLYEQLSLLKGKNFVYLSEFNHADPDNVVVTFDDAYANICKNAAPVLESLKIPFEVFVIGNWVGKWNIFDPEEPPSRLASWNQLNDLVRIGGRLQWHTANHPDLTKVSLKSLRSELIVPSAIRTRFPSPHFDWLSYPYGRYNNEVARAAKIRFKGAVAVDYQLNPESPYHSLTRKAMTMHA